MSQVGTFLKKYTDRSRSVPLWYWIALAAIALVGIALVAFSAIQRVNTVGVTAEGDYFQGNPDAPVTIIAYGNFG